MKLNYLILDFNPDQSFIMTNLKKKDQRINSKQNSESNSEKLQCSNGVEHGKSKNTADNQKVYNGATADQPLKSTANAPYRCNGILEGKTSIEICDLIKESELLTKRIGIHGLLKFILQNLKAIDFKKEADWYKEDKPLPRKHYLVLTIQSVLDQVKKLNMDLVFKNGSIYLFNKEFWEKISEEEFRSFLGKAAERLSVDKIDAKFFKFKEDLYRQFVADGRLNPAEQRTGTTLINLRNGTYEITSDKHLLREFRKADFLTYQLPFDFDPDAEPNLFLNFLNEVLPATDLQQILAEYLGSIFVPSSVLKLEKALFLYGTGSNGKSVIFDIIGAILGKKNLSNYSLESLTNDKDSRAMISDKLLNYCSETSTSVQSEMFKKLVSKEPIDVRPVYKSSFIMENYARLMFNCNELPSDIEHTHAFFRRFLIVPFEVTIKDEDQDKNLSTKIIDSELPGVFNWILRGMQRLLQNQGFTKSTIVEDEIRKFKRESDSVLNFIDEENYQKSTIMEISLKDLYRYYKSFCIESNHRPCSKINFSKRLKNEGIEGTRRNTGQIVFVEKKI